MKKLMSLVAVSGLLFLAGCNNNEIYKTTGYITKVTYDEISEDIAVPKAEKVQFSNYRIVSSAELINPKEEVYEEGIYNYYFNVKGVIKNERTTPVTLKVEVPVYNLEGKLVKNYENTMSIDANSTKDIDLKVEIKNTKELRFSNKLVRSTLLANGAIIGATYDVQEVAPVIDTAKVPIKKPVVKKVNNKKVEKTEVKLEKNERQEKNNRADFNLSF